MARRSLTEVRRPPGDDSEGFLGARTRDGFERLEPEIERFVRALDDDAEVTRRPRALGVAVTRSERELRKEETGGIAHALERAANGAALQRFEGVDGGERALRIAGERFDSGARHTHAEEIGRHVFDLVGFVEHDRVVGREDAGMSAARP